MFPSVYLKKDSSESDVQLSIMNRQSTFLFPSFCHRKNISTFTRMNVRTEEKRCLEKYCVDRRFVRSTLLMFPMIEFGSYVLVLVVDGGEGVELFLRSSLFVSVCMHLYTRTCVLTALDLDMAELSVHWKILQIHWTRCRDR